MSIVVTLNLDETFSASNTLSDQTYDVQGTARLTNPAGAWTFPAAWDVAFRRENTNGCVTCASLLCGVANFKGTTSGIVPVGDGSLVTPFSETDFQIGMRDIAFCAVIRVRNYAEIMAANPTVSDPHINFEVRMTGLSSFGRVTAEPYTAYFPLTGDGDFQVTCSPPDFNEEFCGSIYVDSVRVLLTDGAMDEGVPAFQGNAYCAEWGYERYTPAAPGCIDTEDHWVECVDESDCAAGFWLYIPIGVIEGLYPFTNCYSGDTGGVIHTFTVTSPTLAGSPLTLVQQTSNGNAIALRFSEPCGEVMGVFAATVSVTATLAYESCGGIPVVITNEAVGFELAGGGCSG